MFFIGFLCVARACSSTAPFHSSTVPDQTPFLGCAFSFRNFFHGTVDFCDSAENPQHCHCTFRTWAGRCWLKRCSRTCFAYPEILAGQRQPTSQALCKKACNLLLNRAGAIYKLNSTQSESDWVRLVLVSFFLAKCNALSVFDVSSVQRHPLSF